MEHPGDTWIDNFVADTSVSFIGQNDDTGVSWFWPLEWVPNMSQIHQKNLA